MKSQPFGVYIGKLLHINWTLQGLVFPIYKPGLCDWSVMYPTSIQISPCEIQNPTYWNLPGRNTTAPPPVSSPSNILPPRSSPLSFLFRKEEDLARTKMMLFQSPTL
jgi:hypothetical protein